MENVLNDQNELNNSKDQFTRICVLVVLSVLFTIVASIMTNGSFVSLRNIQNIMRQFMPLMIIGVSMFLVMSSGGIDFSIGSIVGLSGIIFASFNGSFIGVILAIIIGLIIGLTNGLISVKTPIKPYLITIAMMMLLRHMAYFVSKVSPINFPINFNYIPLQAVSAILIVCFSFFLIFKENGIWNKEVKNNSLSKNLNLHILYYVVSAFSATIVGIFLTFYMRTALPQAGSGYELDAIIIAILGGAILGYAGINIISTIIAALLFASFSNLLMFMNLSTMIQMFLKIGILFICFIIIGLKKSQNTETKIYVDLSKLPESKFDGGLFSLIGWKILGFLVTVFTLGICYPWALCMTYGWEINHTIINGRRLKFNGKAISLFGHWLLWLFLCIITLGIYSLWLFIALEKWKARNTSFADETEKEASSISESKFDGGLLSYVGWKILGFLVTVFTLGICYPWALCMTYGWNVNHTIVNGRRLKFNGKAISLFGHWLLWIFLCIITLGIYSFWLSIALKKWIVKNTYFEEENIMPENGT